MKTHLLLLWLAAWVLVSTVSPLRAQIVADGATAVTGGGSLWTNRSILAVGNRAPGNQLIISNGARVASLVGLVSWQPGSSNNLAVVTGSGSTWNSDVNVGGVENGNRQVIEAGGRIIGNIGYVGDSIGERTEALVTGPGSLGSNRTELAVGLNASNQFLVSLATNLFGAGGAFSFTNAIAPGDPQRYFQLRTP